MKYYMIFGHVNCYFLALWTQYLLTHIPVVLLFESHVIRVRGNDGFKTQKADI